MRRRKRRKQTQTDDSWLLPYSDLLTLLVALFIVLFAMGEIDEQKYQSLMNVFDSEFSGGGGILQGGQGNHDQVPVADQREQNDAGSEKKKNDKESGKHAGMQEKEQLEERRKQIDNYIQEHDLADVLATQLSDEGLLITIANDVSFATGSARVNEKGREIAEEIAHFLDTDPPHEIVVSGHTDNRPIKTEAYQSNWELSAMRAINFMHLLLENDNLDPESFSSKAHGAQQPIASNTNKENMAKNRRVEVLVLPNHNMETDKQDAGMSENE